MTIENDLMGNKRIFVHLMLENQPVKIMFDSCGGRGLKISQKIWDKIKSKVNILSSGSEDISSLQFGLLRTERYELQSLNISGMKVEKPVVYVRPDDASNIKSLLSLDMFPDSSVVIDFEKGLFWVYDSRK